MNNNVDSFADRLLPSDIRETILVVVKFRVWGNLRFLSHAEMIKLFQRACVRADIKAAYTQGFNPHIRLSLPLPKSVGIEADCDLLCLQVESSATFFDAEGLKTTLAAQLPDGCRLLSVDVAKTEASFHPHGAIYLFVVRREYLGKDLKTQIDRLLTSKSLIVQRRRYPILQKARKTRFGKQPESDTYDIDVRPFLKKIEMNNQGVVVDCRISPAGSIRIDEILKLLGLDGNMLAEPIRRTNVEWN